MKQKSLLIAFLLMIVLGASAQNNLSRLTVYNEFRPAIAYLADGKKLTLPMANIFLKNSYIREVALGEMKRFPVNIGVAVKGLEYQ